MRAGLILLAVALLNGCATFEGTWHGWNRVDRSLYDASTACVLVDYLQTESALDSGRFEEANPLFGSRPSDDRLAAITGVRLGAHWILAASVPEKYRTQVFGITLTPCLLTVIHNHSIGVRIDL